MQKDSDIRDLVKISQLTGKDMLLVQGTGGNTSVKSPDKASMYIKASGVRLSEVRKNRGYVRVELQALKSLLTDSHLRKLPHREAQEETTRRIQAITHGSNSLRPSLETGFHALLDRVVIHTHPIYLNAFACMKKGEEALEEATGQSTPWASYQPPGYALATEVETVSECFSQSIGHPPSQVVLANHGLITSGQSTKEALTATLDLVAAGRTYFGQLPPDAMLPSQPSQSLVNWCIKLGQNLRERSGDSNLVVRPSQKNALLEASHEPDRWLTGAPLIPDEVVYGTHQIWRSEIHQSPIMWLEKEFKFLPKKMIVVVRGHGVIFVAPHEHVVDIMEEYLLAHVLTRRLIVTRGLIRNLSESNVQYLENMEEEAYRVGLASNITHKVN